MSHRAEEASTLFLLLSLELVLLQLLGEFLLLLLLHVTVEVFGGVTEGGGHQDLAVLAQLVSDADEELLQLHCILKNLRVRPAEISTNTLVSAEAVDKTSV